MGKNEFLKEQSLNEKKLDKGDDGKGMGYLHTVQDYGVLSGDGFH